MVKLTEAGSSLSAMGDKGVSAQQCVEKMPADGKWIHFQLDGSVQTCVVSEAGSLEYWISNHRWEKITCTVTGKAPLRV